MSRTEVKINYFSLILGVAHHLKREIGQASTVVEISKGEGLEQERKVKIGQKRTDQTSNL